MKKLIVLNILVFLFMSASCSDHKPENKIYGKWESEGSPKVTLNFGEDNFLKMEMSSESGNNYKENHQFRIIDEKTAIITESIQPEYKTRIQVKLENDNKIRLDCQMQKSADGKSPIDPPPLCLYYNFKRLE